MEGRTILAKEIEIAKEKARYDKAVKTILANKRILAWIMKSCVEEFRDIDVEEIADKYIEGEPQIAVTPLLPDETNIAEQLSGIGIEDVTITEGTVTFDIRFGAIVPKSGKPTDMIINLEAQNDFYPGYPLIKRGIYYCSRMISSQYGTVFKKSHYEKIKKVYSIWICANPPKERENTINEYTIIEKKRVGQVAEKKENYDLLTAVMLCLGKPDEESGCSILKLLDVLLLSEVAVDEKKRVLESDFNIPMTEKMESEVIQMCNLSDGVERKGMEKGIETTLLASIKSLMDRLKMTAEQAMDALSIPESEQEKYQKMLKQ